MPTRTPPPVRLFGVIGTRGFGCAVESLADYTSGMTDSLTLALCRDLMFGSKIVEAGKRTGAAVIIVREPGKLLDPAFQSEFKANRLIVDLNTPGHLEAAVEWKSKTAGRVIGFVSHVAGDAIAEARRLGVDQVLSNGGFAANVEAIVKNAS